MSKYCSVSGCLNNSHQMQNCFSSDYLPIRNGMIWPRDTEKITKTCCLVPSFKTLFQFKIKTKEVWVDRFECLSFPHLIGILYDLALFVAMDALLFALALEVVLLQMRILESTVEVRARALTQADRAQQDKSARDRQTVKEVIRNTLVEVVGSGEWRTLQQAARALHESESYARGLRVDYDRLKQSRTAVINELKTKRVRWAHELRNADQKIAVTGDKIKDDQQNANARLCYVEKWLFARAESLEMALDEPRAPAPRVGHESRVHDELLRAFELQIKEREDMLEYWRQRYLDDTMKMDERLAAQREQVCAVMARRQELQKLFDLHSGEMRSWMTFKAERAARLAREARRARAATLLQAWWRGVMVRRALGAFKFLKNMKKTPSKGKKK